LDGRVELQDNFVNQLFLLCQQLDADSLEMIYAAIPYMAKRTSPSI